MGGSNRSLVAYDRLTGKHIWGSGNSRAAYSSPMLATLAGRRQVLLLDGVQFAGYDAKTGEELWRHDWKTQYDINVAQPVVLPDDRVFISSGYGHGCALLKITESAGKWSVEVPWQNKNMKCKFTSPVLYQDHLYGLDEGILVCLDVANGSRKWGPRRPLRPRAALLTNGLLVILSDTGKLVLVEATPEGHRELASLHVL